MPIVVPVKFAFAARELWFDPRDLDILGGRSRYMLHRARHRDRPGHGRPIRG